MGRKHAKLTGEAAIVRRLREGYGHGKGAAYKPWLLGGRSVQERQGGLPTAWDDALQRGDIDDQR